MITGSVQPLQHRKCFHSAFPGTVNILNSCLKDIITEFTLISLKKINTFRRVFKFVDYVLGNPLEIKRLSNIQYYKSVATRAWT